MIREWRNGGIKFMAEENGRNPDKTYPESDSPTTKATWSDRDLSAAMGGERLTPYATKSPTLFIDGRKLVVYIYIYISMFCPMAGPSLQAQEPRLQFFRRQVFHHKLRNQGCGFTRD